MSYATKEQLKDIMSDAADKVSGGLSGSEELIRSTVGWTGKNRLVPDTVETITKNGITYTLNKDNSVSAVGSSISGESSVYNYLAQGSLDLEVGKTYVASCGIDTIGYLHIFGTDVDSPETKDWVELLRVIHAKSGKFMLNKKYKYYRFNIYYVSSEVGNVNEVLYPMIYDADIVDDTYEPYHESVETKFEEEIHGVNLLKNENSSPKTLNGITWTENSDGSITANGTADSDTASIYYLVGSQTTKGIRLNKGEAYIISDGLSSHSNSIFARIGNDSDSLVATTASGEAKFIADSSNTIRLVVEKGVNASNITFKPMLRKAEIDDSTYRPYNSTAIKNQIKDIHNVLGAKNLISRYRNSTKTQNGITFTVNDDKSVTVNGTSTANETQFEGLRDTFFDPGTYIISCGSNKTNNNLRVVAYSPTLKLVLAALNDGETEKQFTINERANIEVTIWVNGIGTVVNNVTFYPMLRLASIEDDTYEPYAMTNRQITKVLNVNSDAIPSYIATSLPFRFKDITDEFYNGNLRSEIAAGNFANVRVGDYILGKSTGTKYFVADMDGRLGKGDNTNNTNYPAYGTHHLNLMLFKVTNSKVTKLWNGWGYTDKTWKVSDNDRNRCPWNAATDADPTATDAVGVNNTNITRSYNGTNMSGYMGSFIRERIDAILLPQCFQADFGEANVLKYREINGKTVNTEVAAPGVTSWKGCTTDWGWVDRYLDLPSEVELYGARIFSGAMDVGTQCEQLPLFKHSHIHDSFPRMDIWTKGVASSSYAALRDGDGFASGNYAPVALWACPLACVK